MDKDAAAADKIMDEVPLLELEDNLICPPLFEPTPLCKTTSDDVSAGPELIVICPDISESVDKIET